MKPVCLKIYPSRHSIALALDGVHSVSTAVLPCRSPRIHQCAFAGTAFLQPKLLQQLQQKEGCSHFPAIITSLTEPDSWLRARGCTESSWHSRSSLSSIISSLLNKVRLVSAESCIRARSVTLPPTTRWRSRGSCHRSLKACKQVRAGVRVVSRCATMT